MKKKRLIAAALAASLIVNSLPVLAEETEASTQESTESSLFFETEEETEAPDEDALKAAVIQPESDTEDTEEEPEETESESETEAEDAMAAYRALDYVTLGDYKGLTVELGELAEITEENVESAIKSYLLSALDAGTIPALTEGEVREGDVANIDYEGTLDGVAFDGGSAQGFDLEIGSGRFIEGFEDGLIGMAVGEEKDLDLTFPENYHSEELAGKAVVFHVKVNSIKRPELTDETASLLSEGKTAEEYREEVRSQLLEAAEEQRRNDAQVSLLNQVFANAVVEGYPTEAFEYEFSLMKQYYEAMAGYYGVALEDFLAMYGTTLDALEEMQHTSLTQEMVMLAVAEQEGMVLDDAAYEKGASEYAQSAGVTLEEFEKQYSKNYIRNFLLIDMAVEFLVENANFVEPGTLADEAETSGSEEEATAAEEETAGSEEETTAAEEETAAAEEAVSETESDAAETAEAGETEGETETEK